MNIQTAVETILTNGTIIRSIPNPGVRDAYQVDYMYNGYDHQVSAAVPQPASTMDIYGGTVNMAAFQ